MGTHDGHVIGATKIVDNGPDNRRFNIVVVAEGYRSSELTQFAGDAERLVAELRATPPFTANMPGINVHRLDVRSTDSGADIPASTGTAAVDKRTAFDARFGAGGLSRLLVVDNALVLNAVNAYVATWHAILVIVNSTTYGGAGGAVGTFSLAPGAHRIALHEMGHSAFGLADEYPYWVGCGAETDHNTHPNTEPTEPNVTINRNRDTIKWRSLIAATTAVPTMSNPNCANCDNRASTVPAGTVGAFEGAHYYHCGAYRPEHDCYMRNLGTPFCAVCRGVITARLRPFQPVNQNGALHQFAWVQGTSNYRYGHHSAPYIGITAGPADTDLSRFAMLHDGSAYRLYCGKTGSGDTLYQFSFDGSSYAYGHRSAPQLTLTGFPADTDPASFSMSHDGTHYQVWRRRTGDPLTLYRGTFTPGTTSYAYSSSPASFSVTGFPADTDWARWDTLHDGTQERLFAFKQGSHTKIYQGSLDPATHAFVYGRNSSDMTLLAGPSNSNSSRSAMLHDGTDYRLYMQAR
ncbi:MAG: hypothetical protein H6712_24865 [Myxococcales bacterium]|nr:hypothetical protein [Myxococcales bacterium]